MPDIVNRSRQILDLAESEPGISSAEVAERLGVTRGRVSQIVRDMKDSGQIDQRRKGRAMGLHPTDELRPTSKALRQKILNRRWR